MSIDSEDLERIKAACPLVLGTTQGSGYLVRERHVVTCYHVVEKKRENEAVLLLFGKQKIGAKVVRVNQKADCAVLELHKSPEIQPLDFDPSGLPTEVKCWMYGFPGVLNQNENRAVRLNASINDPRALNPNGDPAILLFSKEIKDCDPHGLSGAPVFSGYRVIGHIQKYDPDPDGKAMFGFVYATRCADILLLLDQCNVRYSAPRVRTMADAARQVDAGEPRDDDVSIAVVFNRDPNAVVIACDEQTDRIDWIQHSTTLSIVETRTRISSALLRGKIGAALATRLDAQATSGRCVVRLQSDDLSLLSLPWEGALLPTHDRPLGRTPGVSISREITTKKASAAHVLSGPLRVLFVVAAPGTEWDSANEIREIADAFFDVPGCRVHLVTLDEGAATLTGLRHKLGEESFHVVHIWARVSAEAFVFEDDCGGIDPVLASELADVLIRSNHPPILVLLSERLEDVARVPTAQVGAAKELIAAGVREVVTSRGKFDDEHAKALLKRFYSELVHSPVSVHAVTIARQSLESEQDRRSMCFGAPPAEKSLHATLMFYGPSNADITPLFDRTAPQAPAPATLTPFYGLPVPPGGVLGRRRIHRVIRSILTNTALRGAILLGMGGVGKSALAASIATGLARKNWRLVVLAGVFSLPALVEAARSQLSKEGLNDHGQKQIEALQGADGDAGKHLEALKTLLATQRILFLFDGFEPNLQAGGEAVPEGLAGIPARARMVEEVAKIVRELANSAHQGALLITCRYPIDGLQLERVEIGPISAAGCGVLARQLPGLRALDDELREEALTTLGGHPRVLEFTDALLQVKSPNWARTTPQTLRDRLEALAEIAGVDPPVDAPMTPKECIGLACRLAATDVQLDSLLAPLDPEARRALASIAVFRRGVPHTAWSHVMNETTGPTANKRHISRQTVEQLRALTLVGDADVDQTIVVHRWLAAEMRRRVPSDQRTQASDQRTHAAAALWLQKRCWEDKLEAVEHWFAAGDPTAAHELALGMREAAARELCDGDALSLCRQMVTGFASDTFRKSTWLRFTARQLRLRGRTTEALRCADEGLKLLADLVTANGHDRDKVERELANAYVALADLKRLLGDHSTAHQYLECALTWQEALAVRGGLGAQRDVALTYQMLGDLHRQRDVHKARKYFKEFFARIERLVLFKHEHPEIRRDLAVAYLKMGDPAAGDCDSEVRVGYLNEAREIFERLVKLQPSKAESRRDLSVCIERLGDERLGAGKYDEARQFFSQCLSIRENLVALDPERAEFRRDLSIACEKVGDFLSSQQRLTEARGCYESAFAIRMANVGREPGRVDLQQDLRNVCIRLWRLLTAQGEMCEARRYYELVTHRVDDTRGARDADPVVADVTDRMRSAADGPNRERR